MVDGSKFGNMWRWTSSSVSRRIPSLESTKPFFLVTTSETLNLNQYILWHIFDSTCMSYFFERITGSTTDRSLKRYFKTSINDINKQKVMIAHQLF